MRLVQKKVGRNPARHDTPVEEKRPGALLNGGSTWEECLSAAIGIDDREPRKLTNVVGQVVVICEHQIFDPPMVVNSCGNSIVRFQVTTKHRTLHRPTSIHQAWRSIDVAVNVRAESVSVFVKESDDEQEEGIVVVFVVAWV